MIKNNYRYHMGQTINRTSNNTTNNMLREPPTSFYDISNIERKPVNREDTNTKKRNSENNEASIKEYPITTPANKALEKLIKNEQYSEGVRNILKFLQKEFLPQINKLEVLLLKNSTYLYIVKILGISKENAVRATGAIATIAIVYTVNSILRRHKNILLDVFTYATPTLSLAEILKKEPELLEKYTKCYQLKTWLIYLIISSLFNITDNFFINKSKPVVEPSITQTVITTTPYVLRDTNKQVFTTIAQVTPFSQRFYNSFSQRVKGTVKYSWYWILKLYIIYWMGYKDGREIIYNKFIIPVMRKYYEIQLNSKRIFSEMDIAFEDSDSFSKKYNFYESSEPINTRLNNTSFLNFMKFNSNSNKILQNDSLSVEDPWKNISFIGSSSNAPIKRNRSFSLNNINQSSDNLNNYRATILDTNNKLSNDNNDTSFEKD
ncbi:hypothetical protein H8356DRAFT_923494 [Neocallimastix lanati (nom. inval.)]|nr:hypothetical protein H8356DRAFT_923494 [Neocallimastix sp. JGI-2020a]